MTYFSGIYFGFEARPESLQRQATDLVEKITINNSKRAEYRLFAMLTGRSCGTFSLTLLSQIAEGKRGALGMTIRITENSEQRQDQTKIVRTAVDSSWLEPNVATSCARRLLLASCLR